MIIKPGAPTISSHTMVPKIPPFLLFIIIYYYRFWSGKNAGKAGNRENSQRTVISPERGKFGTNFCKTKCFLTSKGSWTEKDAGVFFLEIFTDLLFIMVNEVLIWYPAGAYARAGSSKGDSNVSFYLVMWPAILYFWHLNWALLQQALMQACTDCFRNPMEVLWYPPFTVSTSSDRDFLRIKDLTWVKIN